MAGNLEKRISVRRTTKGSITLYSSIGACKEIDGHLLNISERGICFTTKTRLAPGTTILFKATNADYACTGSEAECQLRTISLVTVKWCHESSQHDHPCYIVGATYTVPY